MLFRQSDVHPVLFILTFQGFYSGRCISNAAAGGAEHGNIHGQQTEKQNENDNKKSNNHISANSFFGENIQLFVSLIDNLTTAVPLTGCCRDSILVLPGCHLCRLRLQKLKNICNSKLKFWSNSSYYTQSLSVCSDKKAILPMVIR